MGVLSWQGAVEAFNGDIETAFGWESDEYFLCFSRGVDPLIIGARSDVYMVHKATGVVEEIPSFPGASDEEQERIDKFDAEVDRSHTKWPSGLPYDPSEDD